jgi:hypothetical protein
MVTRAWGYIALADVIAFRRDLAARPEFNPTWAHVVDAGGEVQFDLSSDEILQLAETSVLSPSARRAMVAADPAIFALFRMYGVMFELQVDGSAVGVFRTLDDAIEWVTP